MSIKYGLCEGEVKGKEPVMRWNKDPHNPYSGLHRPSFNWYVYDDFLEGKVDKNGITIKDGA